jgi:hypothetical protein
MKKEKGQGRVFKNREKEIIRKSSPKNRKKAESQL